MKSDLDRLLQERQLDALVVVGPDGFAEVNAPFRYFVGDAHVSGAVLKKRGAAPILLHHDMERDTAESTGLDLASFSRWPLKEIFEAYPTHGQARVELYRRIFEDLEVGGRVAVTGADDVSTALAFWEGLRRARPGLEIVAEMDGTVLDEARLTKDDREVAALERVGRETCALVEEVRELLGEAGGGEDALALGDGPLTVGRLKALIRERMHARGLQALEGFMLSTNRDAGVPHNMGDDQHVLRPHDVVLFDFFPRGREGYWHDVTRTWSLGPPRPEVLRVFEDVRACFEHILERVRPGASTRALQHETCEFFEARGHPTIRQDPRGTSGYVHSLGHGLGLNVHERPHFPTFRAGTDTRLAEGMVITIEPGLYYPERELGVRLEDTIVVTADGCRSLSPVPLDLEVPLAVAGGRAAP